jgi:uncharacterized lipoprotein YbaY
MLDTIRSSLRSTPVSVRDAGEPRPARRLGSAAGIGLRFGWGVVVAMAPAAAQDLRVRDAAVPGAAVPVAAAPVAGVAAAPVPSGGHPLGIMARNTPVGVEVVSVGAGTVAQAVGLEAGDTIVAVNGYQVGLVGDRLYDTGDEVARRINAANQVQLLVRKGRTGSLANVPVQFPAQGPRSVTGVLTSEGGAKVPNSSVVTVRLLDVTDPQWRDVAVTKGQLPVAGGFPVSYRLEPPAGLPQHRYALDARVEDAGRVILQTQAPVALPTIDTDQRADLVLSARGLTAATAASVAPAAQIQQWIQTYLGRPPRPYETEVWLADLQQGRSLANVQAGILSSSEYFERTRSNRDTYVTEVFRQLYGVAPSPAQMADLQARYDRVGGVRLQFVEQLIAQSR